MKCPWGNELFILFTELESTLGFEELEYLYDMGVVKSRRSNGVKYVKHDANLMRMRFFMF